MASWSRAAQSCYMYSSRIFQTFYKFTLLGPRVTPIVVVFSSSIFRRKKTLPGPKRTVSVQFNSVAQSCPTLCNPMNCSTQGLPVHHQLPEFTQTHVHRWWMDQWCHPTISSSVVPFSSCPQSLPASESFPMSQLQRPRGGLFT